MEFFIVNKLRSFQSTTILLIWIIEVKINQKYQYFIGIEQTTIGHESSCLLLLIHSQICLIKVKSINEYFQGFLYY